MTFDLTPTAAQHDLARRTHEFSEQVIRPVAPDFDQKQEFPWPVLEEAAQRGFYSPLFYRDLIGDPTGLSLPMFMEELFWGCAGIGLAIVMPALALSAIGQAASPEQMLEWAPECFGTPGDLKLAALAISEPEGGSDVRNLRTTARRDGSDWIIDGHKMWIGNGGIANVHVVNAVVDEELGHRGQALFIVPGGSPGLELVRKLDKLGCRASHTAELKFHGVRVPEGNLLGGQEKLEHKLAKAREVVAGGNVPARPHWAPSSRPARWSPLRRSASRARPWNTPPPTPPSVRRSAARSSTTRALLFRLPRSPPKSMRRGC
jgi:acyl-CoA dehydrogenase